MSDLASRNKRLMRRVYEEMWNGGNPALAAEIFAQPEGVERFVSQFLQSFPDLQHTAEEIILDPFLQRRRPLGAAQEPDAFRCFHSCSLLLRLVACPPNGSVCAFGRRPSLCRISTA